MNLPLTLTVVRGIFIKDEAVQFVPTGLFAIMSCLEMDGDDSVVTVWYSFPREVGTNDVKGLFVTEENETTPGSARLFSLQKEERTGYATVNMKDWSINQGSPFHFQLAIMLEEPPEEVTIEYFRN